MGVALAASLWPETLDDLLIPASTFDINGISQSVEPLTQYQTNPIGFLVDVLKIPRISILWSLNNGYETHVWDGTPDPLAILAQSLAAWKSTGAESATGTGKTYLAAGLALWFLASWKNSRVFAFAATEDQLRLYIFAEIGKHWPHFQAKFPTAELTDLRIRIDASGADKDAWAMVGRAAAVKAGENVSSRVAGMHAEHMLVITDETQGIPHAILSAIENTCTAPHNLRLGIGNPDNQHDALHVYCASPGVVAVRISALDHPNIVTGNANLIPGAVSAKSISERLTKYGEQSPTYQSRVRGVSPAQAANAMIRLEWLEDAIGRTASGYAPALGVDPSNSEDGDVASLAFGVGSLLKSIGSFPCPDSNKLGEDVWASALRKNIRPEYIGVDNVGVGAGTLNVLRGKVTMDRKGRRVLGSTVQALYGSASPIKNGQRAPDGNQYDWLDDSNEYWNLRSQMYWQAREDLRLGRISIDPSILPEVRLELFRELTTPTYEKRGARGIRVEEKVDIKKRIGHSPNLADAFVYWNWVRPRKLEDLTPYMDDWSIQHGHDRNVEVTRSETGQIRFTSQYERAQEAEWDAGVGSQLPVGM